MLIAGPDVTGALWYDPDADERTEYGTAGRIVAVLAAPGREEIRADLVAAAMTGLRDRGLRVAAITVDADDHALTRTCRLMGFRHDRTDIEYLVGDVSGAAGPAGRPGGRGHGGGALMAAGFTGPVLAGDVPADLVAVAERHGQVVAAGDNAATLADFRPDRTGQLTGSARLPGRLVSSRLLRLEAEPDGLFAAYIRYTADDGSATVLRSRWVRLDEGWRVTQVRNIPATPPVMASAGPRDDGLDAPHWEGLRDGEVRVQRCARCGHWIWAPQPACPRCHGFELAWPAVEPAGTVYSWTRTWQPFVPELSGHVPFVIVLAELPSAGGRRLLGVLHDGDGADMRVGQAVRGEIDPAPDPGGWPVLRWRRV